MFLGLLLIPILMQGQSYLISGNIEHTAGGMVRLAAYRGDRFMLVDSLQSPSGFFYFVLGEDASPGLYRIIFDEQIGELRSKDRFVEFIYNRENIQMVVVAGERGPFPVFEGSLENQVYQEFMSYELAYENQVMRIYPLLDPEPLPPDKFLELAVNYNRLQLDRQHYMDSLNARHPDLYVIRLMNAFRAPLIPGEMSHEERIDTLKTCFFDHAAIDDPGLFYAPVYTFKMIDYLSLYKVDTLSREEQEAEFILAVDHIMAHVAEDDLLRSFVVDFLLSGFEMLDMEQVQFHLAEHYLDEYCESDIGEIVQARMQAYEELSEGKQAPDLQIRDQGGKLHTLSRTDQPFTLVLFWSTSCEHCRRLLPQLKQWYLEQKPEELRILAISIDSSEAAFNQFVEEEDFPWISAREPLGWRGQAASDYQIYATPSMFLLDRDGVIISKPLNIRQIQRSLRRQGQP